MKIRNKYDERDSSNVFLGKMLLPFVVTLLFNLIAVIISAIKGVPSESVVGWQAMVICRSMVIYLCYGIFIYFYDRILKINFISATKIKPNFKIWNIIIVVIIAGITLFGFMDIVNLLTDLMKLTGFTPDTSMPLPLNTPGWLVINIIVLAVFPAIFEELLYRGVIMNGLRKYGNIVAVFVSALIFAFCHLSAVQTIYQFIFGVVLGFVLIKTGSILYTIIIHFINNFIVVLVSYLETVWHKETISRTIFEYSATEIILPIVYAILAAATIYILIKILHIVNKKKVYYKEEEKSEKEDSKATSERIEHSNPPLKSRALIFLRELKDEIFCRNKKEKLVVENSDSIELELIPEIEQEIQKIEKTEYCKETNPKFDRVALMVMIIASVATFTEWLLSWFM